MPLQPEVQLLLDGLAAAGGTPLEEMSAPDARQMFTMMNAALPTSAPDVPTSSRSVGDVPVRVYDPPGSSPAGPTLVWYHAGGWVIGDLDTTDPACRYLASLAGIRVVSVDYRLAPEYRFPAAVDDAYAVFSAVAAGELGGPPSVVAVGGDSAGGNLAAVVPQMVRDRGGAVPAFQLLIYPVTDAAMDTPSQRDNGEGHFLTASAMRWFWDQYAPGVERLDPYASPLRATSLAGLPPALVITAEYDPLRDEGEAYAAALEAAGVPVKAHRYDGQIHGFLSFPEMCGPTAMAAIDEAAAALRDL
ncbi:MAG: alpha/beta hydrolase [Acidimicrobiales bacterium]